MSNKLELAPEIRNSEICSSDSSLMSVVAKIATTAEKTYQVEYFLLWRYINGCSMNYDKLLYIAWSYTRFVVKFHRSYVKSEKLYQNSVSSILEHMGQRHHMFHLGTYA